MSEHPALAMAVIVEEGRLLLIRRSVVEEDLVWALPGGTVEPGEAAEQTAVREALEETGLTVEAVEDFGERVHPDTGRRITYVACMAVAGAAHSASPREVATIAWAEPGEIRQYVPRGLYPPVPEYLDRRQPTVRCPVRTAVQGFTSCWGDGSNCAQ
ncbi:NUDIX hydrolase [Streptomyces sp. NPDC001852]|uniref:NUDIX hydrolase n=1 Tax=Streptomyces sp. NPDC001852 TaxID=3364619 RepID=UPI0036B79A4F